MKIRNSFVSNSSSSSFIALINDDGVRELLAMTNDTFETNALVNLLGHKKVFGKLYTSYESFTGEMSDDYINWNDVLRDIGEDCSQENWNKLYKFASYELINRIRKINKDNVFIHELEF